MSSKEQYDRLASDRAQYLQRARHNALVTLPSLMPLDGRSHQSHLVEPYQGLGAMGVTHLSSRMTIGLLPAGRPFMRFDLPARVMMQFEGEIPTDVTVGLAKAEQMVQAEVEQRGWRETTLMSIQQLLVAGNVVEYLLPDNSIRLFRLDQFVCQYDLYGMLVLLIIEEKFPRSAAPEGIPLPSKGGLANEKDDELCLYTHIERKSDGSYTRHQEWSNGERVGKSTTWRDYKEMPYTHRRSLNTLRTSAPWTTWRRRSWRWPRWPLGISSWFPPEQLRPA